MTQPTRFGRIPIQKVFFDERDILSLSEKPEKFNKSHVEVLETRAASENAPPVVHELASQQPTAYSPPIQVDSRPFKVLCKAQDSMSLFMTFLGGIECLRIICIATNEYAAYQVSTTEQGSHPRPWTPLDPAELIRWLGILFYIAVHGEINRQEY